MCPFLLWREHVAERRHMRLFTFLSLALSLSACADVRPTYAVTQDPAAAPQERLSIEAAFERWLKAYESGDPEALASLFTEDAIYAANTGEVLTGRDEIRSGVAAWMQGSSRVGQQRAKAALDVQRRSLRFRQAGSLGYDLLRFTISMNPPGCLIDAGHALAVWEKQPDGRWLIDALTVNQDKAPPPNACRRP